MIKASDDPWYHIWIIPSIESLSWYIDGLDTLLSWNFYQRNEESEELTQRFVLDETVDLCDMSKRLALFGLTVTTGRPELHPTDLPNLEPTELRAVSPDRVLLLNLPQTHRWWSYDNPRALWVIAVTNAHLTCRLLSLNTVSMSMVVVSNQCN